MTTLTFTNKGEIDPRAFTTFGVNAKPNSSNPVGFFGTGLKYALAIVARLGGTVVIYSGKTKYAINATPGKFRDREIIELSYTTGSSKKAVPLPFTADLGKTWEPWMAFRELYCNALDEGGECFLGTAKPMTGFTNIVIDGAPQLVEAFEKRSAFMLDKFQRPLLENSSMRVLPGRSNGIYFRGILIGQTEDDHDFTYDILSPVELTEDRTMKNAYMFPHYVANFWKSYGDSTPNLLRQVLSTPRGSFEAKLPWAYLALEPSDGFLEVVGALRREGAVVHDGVRDLHDKMVPLSGEPEAVDLTAEESEMLKLAIGSLKTILGYDVDNVPITVVRSLGAGTLGLHKRGRIYLSKRAFEAGQTYVTGTLLEEYGHARLSWVDESREMQNCLINLAARLVERLHSKEKVEWTAF